MKIHNTEPQLNSLNAAPTEQISRSTVSAVRNLSKQGDMPDVMRLMHNAVDQQIHELKQEKLLAMSELQKQLSTLKDAGIFQKHTASTINIVATHMTIAAIQIINTNKKTHNLETLKSRNFKPIKEGALIIPFSGKALGGMRAGSSASGYYEIEEVPNSSGYDEIEEASSSSYYDELDNPNSADISKYLANIHLEAQEKYKTKTTDLNSQKKALKKQIKELKPRVEKVEKQLEKQKKKDNGTAVDQLIIELRDQILPLKDAEYKLKRVEQELRDRSFGTDVGCYSRWLGKHKK